jgi:uncharacterized membrane protein YfcA
MNTSTIAILMMVGLSAGFLSGLVGVGGGIIIVPSLIFFLGFSQKAAQGTSLGLLLLPVSILAAFNYYNNGFINWKVIGIMCTTFILGGWIGSRLALSIPEMVVKKLFGALLLYTAFRMMGWDLTITKWLKHLL